MAQWQDGGGEWDSSVRQPQSRYQEEGHHPTSEYRRSSRYRYNDDNARNNLHATVHADPRGSPPEGNEGAFVIATSPTQGRWQHDRFEEQQGSPMPSPAPFGPGPTEPVRRSNYESGSCYARTGFSPGYGMRGAGTVDDLPPREQRVTHEGSYHRVYPAPAETSPPINIDEGWEDDSTSAGDHLPLIQRLTVADNERSDEDHSASRLDVGSKQGGFFVPDPKESESSKSKSQRDPTSPGFLSTAEKPVSREEMLEVLSHMRRDRDGAGPQDRGPVNEIRERGHGDRQEPFGERGQMARDNGWISRGPRHGGEGAHNGEIFEQGPPHRDRWQHGQLDARGQGARANIGHGNEDDDGWGDDPTPPDRATRGQHRDAPSVHEESGPLSAPQVNPARSAGPGIHPDRLRMMEANQVQNNAHPSRAQPPEFDRSSSGFGGRNGDHHAETAPRASWSERMGGSSSSGPQAQANPAQADGPSEDDDCGGW